ncbi:MAG: hypothetical protein WC593_11660 [Methanoregula sp.]
MARKTLTTEQGIPVVDNQNSVTISAAEVTVSWAGKRNTKRHHRG